MLQRYIRPLLCVCVYVCVCVCVCMSVCVCVCVLLGKHVHLIHLSCSVCLHGLSVTSVTPVNQMSLTLLMIGDDVSDDRLSAAESCL